MLLPVRWYSQYHLLLWKWRNLIVKNNNIFRLIGRLTLSKKFYLHQFKYFLWIRCVLIYFFDEIQNTSKFISHFLKKLILQKSNFRVERRHLSTPSDIKFLKCKKRKTISKKKQSQMWECKIVSSFEHRERKS